MPAAKPNQSPDDSAHAQKRVEFLTQLRETRHKTTLLRAPFTTLGHFFAITAQFVIKSLRQLFSHTIIIASLILLGGALAYTYANPGPHTEYLLRAQADVYFAVWWVGLGILSSIGLGSGLHTFVLYLGPFIGKVTLAAASCQSLDFDTEGPRAFVCRSSGAPGVSTWEVFWQVQMACFLWGAGTAIGELPPYFMSRAAAQAGEKMAELDEAEGAEHAPESMLDRLKPVILSTLQKYGFWAIMAGASIPNPLFDLAGLACGHFGVPFLTFFSATFLGKAVIKAHGQSLFVILAMSEHSLDKLVQLLTWASPAAYSERVNAFLLQRIAAVKEQFQRTPDPNAVPEPNLVSRAWDLFLGSMLLFFLVSIIDSLVQQRLAEDDERQLAEFDRKHAKTK